MYITVYTYFAIFVFHDFQVQQRQLRELVCSAQFFVAKECEWCGLHSRMYVCVCFYECISDTGIIGIKSLQQNMQQQQQKTDIALKRFVLLLFSCMYVYANVARLSTKQCYDGKNIKTATATLTIPHC